MAAVHVDHMLRGEESAEDGIFVKAICEKLGIPFFGGKCPSPPSLKRKAEMCRISAALEDMHFFDEVMRAERYEVLATAHHAEDQLETVLDAID